MKLYAQLQVAKTEEDVKDAYIKALGLKGYSKGLIDIRTDEIWFEAKDTGKNSCYAMFTQLLHYVQDALNKGEPVPPLLAVIDTEKAALMKSADVLPFLAKKTIKWGKSASQYTQQALDEISSFIGTYFVQFKVKTHEDEFISTVKAAIQTGDIIRTQITPDNLKQVFDKWVEMIGREITGVAEEDYALLFFADIMNDGTVSTHANLPAELLHKNGRPVFALNGRNFELGNQDGYRQFWTIYHRPPKSEYRDYLLERRDSLIPIDERSFKGAYYTPLHVVDKAYDKLSETLGKNWQKEYIVWDMCCGVGNLEVKHSNRTASANGLEWNGKKWSIVNHFIPYTENEVGAADPFESYFMVDYLSDKTLSDEATAVLDAGRVLWRAYFAYTDVRSVREQYKLNRPDVGWYQIRNALGERNKSGDTAPINFSPLEEAYATLTEKLRPQVFSLGFLR